MKVLVTGGAGFIGAHLVRELLRRKVEVVVLDNFSTGSRANLPAEVEIIERDVCDESAANEIVSGKFDAAVHLAGQTTVNESIKNPKVDARINILGTLNLLEAARRSGTLERIIFASTAAVYGNCAELPIVESQPTNPLSFYAFSKIAAENYLQLYQKLFGLNYIVLRFANVYGEYQGDRSEGGVIGIFAKRLVRGEVLTIYGDGEQTRDFIHAQDVAFGIYRALSTPNCNEIFNISSQTEISLNELVATLGEVSGKNISVVREPARVGDIKNSMLSNVRAIEKLAWRPAIKLVEGLGRTFKYFEDLGK